jgi:hypothetical protein
MLVLFRTGDRWRFATYTTRGVMDGSLVDVSLDADERQAQDALLASTEEFFQGRCDVTWTPSDKPGWWTGEVLTFTS